MTRTSDAVREQPGSGIVIGHDGSNYADAALRWAVKAAAHIGQELTVVRTVQLESVPQASAAGEFGWVSGPEYLPEDDSAIEAAQAELGADVVHVVSAVGNPAARLVEESATARLVVLGSRGRSPLSAALLGSTAYAVAAHAHCPVIVVRPQDEDHAVWPGPGRPVLVGVDDGHLSGHALQAGARIASETGADLELVRAVDLPAYLPGLSLVGTDDVDAELRRRAHSLVDDAQARAMAAHPGLATRAEVVDGPPAYVLARRSADAGLLVVGSRGRGGFTGLLLGSVSHQVLHVAQCPVMIVR